MISMIGGVLLFGFIAIFILVRRNPKKFRKIFKSVLSHEVKACCALVAEVMHTSVWIYTSAQFGVLAQIFNFVGDCAVLAKMKKDAPNNEPVRQNLPVETHALMHSSTRLHDSWHRTLCPLLSPLRLGCWLHSGESSSYGT